MKNYEVIAVNIGTVYDGTDQAKAQEAFDDYIRLSKAGYGRVGGEDVIMLVDGEIDQEYMSYKPTESEK